MANRYATKAGNWSDTTVWNGGTLPQPGDVVRPNNFVVTIDQDVNVSVLKNDAASPAVGGGSFTVAAIPGGGRIITATLENVSSSILSISAPSGTLTINGEVGNGAGTGGGPSVVFIAASGFALIINGNLTSSLVSGNHNVGINCQGHSLSITVNGNVTGGVTASSTGIFATTGNVVIVVTGSCTANSSPAINTGGPSVIDCRGPLVASTAAPAVRASGVGAVTRCRGPFVHAANNRTPIVADSFMVTTGANTSWQMKDDSAAPAGGANVNMTNYVTGSPPPEDVRAGVHYGPGGTLVGTMAVPPAAAVVAGAPVDNTTGTATLSQAAVATVVGAQLAAALNGGD